MRSNTAEMPPDRNVSEKSSTLPTMQFLALWYKQGAMYKTDLVSVRAHCCSDQLAPSAAATAADT